MTTERSITDRILAYLRRRPDTWAVKIGAGPYQRAGLPDILACTHGRLVALEAKRPGKKATPLQAATLAAIRRAGGIAAVVTSVDEVAEILGDAIIPEPARNGARMPVDPRTVTRHVPLDSGRAE